MSQEQNFDLTTWWGAQIFDGKQLFTLNEAGELLLTGTGDIKERIVATIDAENADGVMKDLLERYTQLHTKVNELELEWVAAEDKLKLADKVAHISEQLRSASALGDLHRLHAIVADWQHTIHTLTEEAYAAKLKIVEQAESLAESTDWKETTVVFKDITDKWKQAGHIDKHRSDKLWNRIEAARTTFYDRKRKQHEEEEKDLLHNLDLKIDLVEQAESMANSTEWKKSTETFHRLTEEWKGIGHTLNKKNEELWQRFQAAKNIFFENKRQHYAHVQQEQEVNYGLKLALVEKAEALKESKEWNATAQAYAALMEEWKKTGRVPQEKGDELWKRFTDAQELFFSAKKKHAEGIRTMHQDNYDRKAEILKRAEQVKNSNRWGETTAEMNQLFEDWKKIGPIAREHGNKMWEDFLAARKHFFNRKDANREQRKEYMEFQKQARTEQARNMISRLQHDIISEEEKLVDFANALDNVTPGKKADELRTHLETLIADSTAKLKRLKEKFAAVTDEMRPEDKTDDTPAEDTDTPEA